jgi:predicted transcriptional regulator
MSETDIRELRARIARVGIRQNDIATRLPCPPSSLSDYLSGKTRIPEATALRLEIVVAELTREMAEKERADGEARAKALLEAAGIKDTHSAREPITA